MLKKEEKQTYSMCQFCYRHVPAFLKTIDNYIYLCKECPEHGYQEDLVEIDKLFYYNMDYEKRNPSSYWLDISNKCNLACPHCYQIPDNTSIDPTINQIVKEIQALPENNFPISLVGAEPTTRDDLPLLINKIQQLTNHKRLIVIVSNGVNLAKKSFTEKFQDFKNVKWTIGLNHPDYNGQKIRKKQEIGLQNCLDLGIPIKTLTYTLGNINQLEYTLEEIKKYYKKGICENARIQVGVDIGRTPGKEYRELFLSDLVNHAKKVCKKNNWSFDYDMKSSNRTHYAASIDGITHRFIKWCDVRTINFEETQSESWAKLVPEFPMTSLLHQIIIRDRAVNNRLPLLDKIPYKYTHDAIIK